MDFSFINEIILSVVLGIVQGITEFLPVSSTAHQRLAAYFLVGGRDIGLSASNMIQFGTLFAILVYFKDDLKQYYQRVRQILNDQEEREIFRHNFAAWWNSENRFKGSLNHSQTDITLAQLITGTLPLLVLGYFLHDFAEASRSLNYIAAFLLAGSALLAFAEWQHKQLISHPEPRQNYFTRGEVILIGLFQTLAAFPGISRSGATLSGALLVGKDRAKSVRFSFLLSIPAILLLSIYDLLKVLSELFRGQISLLPQSSDWTNREVGLSLLSLAVGFVLSYFFGLICLKWLLKFLSKNTNRNFIIYRVILAIVLGLIIYLG